jgi:hypothetical protein
MRVKKHQRGVLANFHGWMWSGNDGNGGKIPAKDMMAHHVSRRAGAEAVWTRFETTKQV